MARPSSHAARGPPAGLAPGACRAPASQSALAAFGALVASLPSRGSFPLAPLQRSCGVGSEATAAAEAASEPGARAVRLRPCAHSRMSPVARALNTVTSREGPAAVPDSGNTGQGRGGARRGWRGGLEAAPAGSPRACPQRWGASVLRAAWVTHPRGDSCLVCTLPSSYPQREANGNTLPVCSESGVRPPPRTPLLSPRVPAISASRGLHAFLPFLPSQDAGHWVQGPRGHTGELTSRHPTFTPSARPLCGWT